jgi:hypothetical protein
MGLKTMSVRKGIPIGPVILGGLWFLLAGCTSLFGSKGLPEDPLFLSRKPIEAKAEMSTPVHISYSEPRLPLNNVGSPVVQKKPLEKRPSPNTLVPAVPTNRSTFPQKLPEYIPLPEKGTLPELPQ